MKPQNKSEERQSEAEKVSQSEPESHQQTLEALVLNPEGLGVSGGHACFTERLTGWLAPLFSSKHNQRRDGLAPPAKNNHSLAN